MAVYLVAYDQQSKEPADAEFFHVLRGLGAEPILQSVFVVASSGDAQSLHDGYFFFERVPPGEYSIRIDPEQAAKLAIQLLNPVPLKAGADGGLVGEIKVEIGRAPNIAQQGQAAPSGAQR
jgi:hypothetical protein